jgi:FkbM family methyltransferase
LKVSIVVPVYDAPVPLLAECLASIGRQTLRPDDYEILIVDDGSTDKAMIEAVESFAMSRDNCVVIHHDVNRGLNQARLTGALNARGEFVLYVDGDDIISRDAAELLYLQSVHANADVVTAPCYRWSPESSSYDISPAHEKPYPQALTDRMKAALSGEHSFTMCGRLFRRTLLDETTFAMPATMLHEDLVTSVRILFKAYRVSAISEPIYYYTINKRSISSVFTTRHADGLIYAIKDWIRQADDRGMAHELESSIQRGAERLVNTFVLRFARSADLTLQDKLTGMREIDQSYNSLPFPRPEPTLPGTKILEIIRSDPAQDSQSVQRVFDRLVPPERWTPLSRYERTLAPTPFARRLKGKIVIIGQADYHIRNAARLARAIRQRGLPCVVIDNSAVADAGRRQLGSHDKDLFWRTEHITVGDERYGVDWLGTASLVIVFNDFNPMFREALEYRHRLGLPTVCMVEGINDFLRVDSTILRALPYRRCDYVFLAGEDDQRFFQDRPTFVVGIPSVEALAATQPAFPEQLCAVLNVNFTYGVLEEKRTEFVRAAQAAFDTLGISWVITQHPMDNGDLVGLPVSDLTQQQLIDRCSVFVSRFATGIIDALAAGKPAIYFNPHGEQVAKYSEPLGAFDIATSPEELIAALRRVEADIASGVDFRARAASFLQHHAGYAMPDGTDVGSRFAAAVSNILTDHEMTLAASSTFFLERLEELEPFRQERPGLVLGEFVRAHGAQLNEEEMIGRCFESDEGMMFDVGANYGNSADVYLGKGWTVHAFEPDPTNRTELEKLWPGCERLVINPEAVSDTDGLVVPLFASEESSGISSLSAFTDGHRHVAEVTTVTLATYMNSTGIQHIDFLKIDVEGFDKFVLDGFPWDRDRPDAILVEFEDAKTVPLGYRVADLVELLEERGYTVYASEWYPVVRYGIAHDWKSLRRYDPAVDLAGTWGNLVAFYSDPGEEALARAAAESVRFVVDDLFPETAPNNEDERRRATGRRALSEGEPDTRDESRQTRRIRQMLGTWRRAWETRTDHTQGWLYAEFANGVRTGMPTVFRIAQIAVWQLRAARRHWIAATSLAVAILVAALLPVIANEPGWRPWSWSIAAALAVLAIGLSFGSALSEALRRLSQCQELAIDHSHRDLEERVHNGRSGDLSTS